MKGWAGLLLLAAPALARAENPGDATWHMPAGTSELVVATSARFAGAIYSVRWGGKEFIDASDHGRELQSACSFDLARCAPFWAECFNPTEAGSRNDGTGPTSTSQLLAFIARSNELRTAGRMAFWLAPGERSAGRPALNTEPLSSHYLRKRVLMGTPEQPQVLDYAVEFVVPVTEFHLLGQFEALTGYMPAEFNTFWAFNPATRDLEPLTDGPGEQDRPVVLSTATGSHAMGIYAEPADGCGGPRYGRWRFERERVVKWNCVFRARDPKRLPPGSYRFHLFVPVGSRDEVRTALADLTSLSAPTRIGLHP